MGFAIGINRVKRNRMVVTVSRPDGFGINMHQSLGMVEDIAHHSKRHVERDLPGVPASRHGETAFQNEVQIRSAPIRVMGDFVPSAGVSADRGIDARGR